MNIFVLDTDIVLCARYHCDRHVSKMILESVQILCTALNEKGYQTPYKSTHRRHPCVVWVNRSYDNFLWLAKLADELNREYRYRYHKKQNHASIRVLNDIRHLSYESRGLTEFAQAMPDEFKVAGDAVLAYRAYYLGDKYRIARWTRRSAPCWWISNAA